MMGAMMMKRQNGECAEREKDLLIIAGEMFLLKVKFSF
jgi:hypothetical protein